MRFEGWAKAWGPWELLNFLGRVRTIFYTPNEGCANSSWGRRRGEGCGD